MQSYVMDLDTEGLFALLPEANRDWVARVVAWTPANEAVVQVGRSDGAGGYRVYAGGPKQAFRLVYRGDAMIYGASVSPDGSLLALAGQKTVVVTLDSGQVVAELGQTGSGAMWSADGRFMAVTVGAPYSTVVWDSRTGERLQLEGLPGAWSHRGHYLAYFAGSDADLTLTVRNFDDGQEFRIQAGSGRAEWSLDDRYLAANATAGEHTVVNIFDMTGKDPQVRIHAAAFGDWLDSRTLFFSGNYCSGFDIFTVKAEGTDLVNHTENEPAAFEPVLAPAGKGIFYAHTKLLRIGEGSVTIPDTGASLSAGNGPAGWSPDGRYVVLSWIGGRCGPCMGMDAPEPPTTVEVFD